VLQTRGGLGLVAKHRDEVFFFEVVRQHALDTHAFFKARLRRTRAKDLGHSAHRQAIFENVATVRTRKCHD
jgi:hypothetical protein